MVRTTSVATATTEMVFNYHARCVIRFGSRRGSNALIRRQMGECEDCGAKWVRTLDWRTREERLTKLAEA